MRGSTIRRIGVVALGLALIAGVAGPADAASKSKANTAKSAKDVGGMKALIALAKKEGQLNVIALPPDWANYGEIISTFSKKYGIKVNSMNPDASSADEIVAIKSLAGQNRQPDVIDVSLQFAVQGATEGLLAPYKVMTWNDIQADAKDKDGLWYSDYGGYIGIGYNAKLVNPAPKCIKDLTNPAYKNQVALNGDPTRAGAAFAGVFAASLANGGSANDISKGVQFFSDLKKAGNFIPVEATPATVQSGQTPITLDWDYLQGKYKEELSGKVDWKVVVPCDAIYGGFYAQAVVKNSPNPAAARLWQEFLYSDEGQNLWLKGGARPIRLNAMIKKGTANKTYIANLPELPAGAKPVFASLVQQLLAKVALAGTWSKI